MEAKLIVIGGKANKSEVKLKLPTVIGRSRSADLTVQHPKVSRQHCQIFERDGALMVRDNGSLNGTYVENNRITEAVLRPGDKLTVGPLTFVAVYEHTGTFPQMPVAVPKPKPAGDDELDTPDFKATAPDEQPAAPLPAAPMPGVAATVADSSDRDWFNYDPEPDVPLSTMAPSPPLNSKPAAKLPAAPKPDSHLDETHDFNQMPASGPPSSGPPSSGASSASVPATPSPKPPESVHPSDPTFFSVGEELTLATQKKTAPIKAPKPAGQAGADDLSWLDEESDQNLGFTSSSEASPPSASADDSDPSGQTMQQSTSAAGQRAEQISDLPSTRQGANEDFSWLEGPDAKTDNPLFGLSSQFEIPGEQESVEPGADADVPAAIAATPPMAEPSEAKAAEEAEDPQADEGFSFKPMETSGASSASTLPDPNEAAKKKAWWPFGKKKEKSAVEEESPTATAVSNPVPSAPVDTASASEAPTTKVDTEPQTAAPPPIAGDDDDLNNFFKSLG